MPDSDFNVDPREIRFALYEGIPFDKLANTDRFDSLDRESIDLLMDEALRFAKEVVAPIDAIGDREGCKFENGKVIMPAAFKKALQAMRDNGWISLTVPEAYGGMALPYLLNMAIGEVQVGACCSMSLCIGLTDAAASLLHEFGTSEMKEKYLNRLWSGEWQGTMCLTEPQAGTAVGDLTTKAEPAGDKWKIKGTKIFITAGDHDMTDNHLHLVLARTPGAPAGIKGISLFLVPKFRDSGSGKYDQANDVVCSGIEHKMGIHASPTCVLQFGENDDCYGELIGEEGKGIICMFHMMNHARLGVGLQGLALAAQAYNYARAYAHERVQGTDIENFKDANAERVKITQHPNVRRMLLWTKSMVDGCRALLYTTSYFGDMADALEEHDPEEAKRYRGMLEFLTPVCKAYISDQAFEVTRLSMQVMGGYGYIAEYPIERFMRDAKIASIYEGTNGVQALDLIGRKLPAKNGAYFRSLLKLIQDFAKEQKGHLALGDDIAYLNTEVERWMKVTMELGMKGMSGDKRYPVLSASPYLKMTGHITSAWLLLRQAVIAHDSLQSLYISKEAHTEESRQALLDDNDEAQFLFNKIETARFFLYNILSENAGIGAQIRSDDRSALRYFP